MRQAIIYLSLGVFLAAAGCDISKGFQPPPPAHENWIKSGASRLDVQKSLLECGRPSPVGSIGRTELTMNDYATIDFCMERAGYRKKRGGASSWCANHADANLPICRPGATIPAPSVKKRLNSRYCMKKDNRDGPECRP